MMKNESLLRRFVPVAAICIATCIAFIPDARAAASLQCATAAIDCGEVATGLVLECAADAATDGATTLACLSAWKEAGGVCAAAAVTCKGNTVASINNVTEAAINDLGNTYTYGNYQELKCSGNSRVNGILAAAREDKILNLSITCTNGEIKTSNPGIYGNKIEFQSCDTGQLLTGIYATWTQVAPIPNQIQSLKFVCGDISKKNPASYSEQIGFPAGNIFNTAGCPRTSYPNVGEKYVYGIRIFQDYNIPRVKRSVYGLQVICR